MATDNYNARLPVTNRRSTILGATIPFEIIATFAVILRVYARLKTTRSRGWDDVFVLLAWISISIGEICIYISTDLGLGHNFYSIPPEQLRQYLKVFYIANSTYATSTAFIKISLLLQYLRMPAFQANAMRKACYTLLALVSVWGFIMMFISWFPCFPVKAYWDRSIQGATCYGWGADVEKPFVATFIAQESTNAVFDILVLFLPLILYLRRGLSGRELTAVIALSCIGLTVVAVSMAHLAELVIHKAGWAPHMNLTYYAPLPIMLACIEVDLAIIAASIPIFWPVIEASIDSIFVTREVTVTTTHRRLADDDLPAQELEMTDTRSFADSETGLHGKHSVDDIDLNNAFFIKDEENMKAHGHVTHIETTASKGEGKTSLSIDRETPVV